MRKDMLTEAEDLAFSERVIRYNGLSVNGIHTEEGEYIRERTKNLVYLICKEKLLMSDDLISSVFLNIYDDLDKVISSYRIASTSFNHYLRQVCIYRLRRVRRSPEKQNILEAEYMRETTELYTIDEINTAEEYDDHYQTPVLMCNPRLYSSMNMAAVTNHIIEERNSLVQVPRTAGERALRNRLEKKRFRRNFLVFILSLPPSDDEEKDAKNYARVFQSDEAAFSRLFFLKNEILRNRYPERQKNLEKAAMHWRLMAKIKNSMCRASSREEYSLLKENYHSQVRCHRNRIADASRALKGIIHEDIASAMGLSRSTVSMAICLMRKELERITGSISE